MLGMPSTLPRNRSLPYNPVGMHNNDVKTGTSAGLLSILIVVTFVVSSLLPLGDAEAQRKKVVFGEEEEAEVVEGYVHKPEVGYIITRQEQEDLETLQLKESFAPRIVRSVEKAPF